MREPYMKLIPGELHQAKSLLADVHPRGLPPPSFYLFIDKTARKISQCQSPRAPCRRRSRFAC